MTASKKKRTRRSFSDEFKREAVALFQGSGVSAEQVCAELGNQVYTDKSFGTIVYNPQNFLL